jgi:hypothetical protein
MIRVEGGRIQPVEITGVPAGRRMVAGGELVIPDHGLAEQDMLVPVLPGKPLASMTLLLEGRTPFKGLRMNLKTPQKSLPVAVNMLASTKAGDPACSPQLEFVQTAF